MLVASHNQHSTSRKLSSTPAAYQLTLNKTWKLTMEDWTCTICEMTMQMQSRESHLAGSRHRTAARGSWSCLICDTEMQMESRDSHLAGRRHTDTENIQLASHAQQSSAMWKCPICDIEMSIGNRASHLTGRRHADAESESIAQAAISQETSIQWTCLICEIEMPIGNRDSHLAGKRHAAAVPQLKTTTASSSSTNAALQPPSAPGGSHEYTAFKDLESISVSGWECKICSCHVSLAAMQSHLRTLNHMQKILEVLKITCKAMPQSEIQGSLKKGENLQYQVRGLLITNSWANKCDQDVVEGTKSLVTYLTTQSSRQNVPSHSSPPIPKSKPTTKPATKSRSKTASQPPPSAPPALGPLDAFFLSFPTFPYDPTIPPASSFRSFQAGLSNWNDFDKSACSTWNEYKNDVWERYQAALTQEFNLWFGTEDELESWYALCRAIGIVPLPKTRGKCREVSY